MKILAIGDVTDKRCVEYLARKLWDYRRVHGIDGVILNAENAGFITGPTPDVCRALIDTGADVLTGGNHTLHNAQLLRELDNLPLCLRPLNFPDAPGEGAAIVPMNGWRVLVINLIGRALMNLTVDCPFRAADRALDAYAGKYDFALVDFHAEASGEKMALAHYLDGRVAAVFGTHTHVPTADVQILPGGCGYVTDLGMCGARDSVIGMDPDSVIRRYLTGVPTPLLPGTGEIRADGVLFTLEGGRCTAAERVVL